MPKDQGSLRSGTRLAVPSPGAALRLRMELVGTPTWRTLEIDSTLTLDALVQVFQAAMGWRNVHLHEIVSDVPRSSDEWAVASGTVLPARGAELVYVYDLRRRHEHRVTVTSVAGRSPGDPRARLRDGAGPCPADTAPASFGEPDHGGPVAFHRATAAAAVSDAVHLPHGRREVAGAEAVSLARFLEWIGEGVELNGADEFTRSQVSEILDAHDWRDGMSGGPELSETRAYPVRALVSRARSLGLVEVGGGAMGVTRRGERLASTPSDLVDAIIEAFPRSVLWGAAPRGWVVRR